MSLKHIALVTGGYSGEAVISYRTARTIQQQLDPSKYQTYWIDITTAGWFYEDEKKQFKERILAKMPIVKKNNNTICILA